MLICIRQLTYSTVLYGNNVRLKVYAVSVVMAVVGVQRVAPRQRLVTCCLSPVFGIVSYGDGRSMGSMGVSLGVSGWW